MTVGIALTNGLEALVITDSRVSGSGRQSDSVNKMGEFSHNNYSGVIFGTGDGSFIKGIIDNLKGIKGENLDEYVKSIQRKFKGTIDDIDNEVIGCQRDEIRKKSGIIDDDRRRKKFVQQETAELLQRYDRNKQDPQNSTFFVIAAYDKNQNKIRLFSLNWATHQEVNMNHVEIGSGNDAANLYLGTKLQGIDTKKLSADELRFFLTNAYCMSTVNEGVGGTPKIAKVSKDDLDVMPLDKTRGLVNLSGAYLSELNPNLSPSETIGYFKEIINNPRPKYGKISKLLGINKQTLIGTYIPYSSWQERANNKIFNGKK